MVVSDAMRIEPSSGSSKPASILSSVVLPAPFGPGEPDAVALLDVPGHVVQQDALAVSLGQAFDVDH